MLKEVSTGRSIKMAYLNLKAFNDSTFELSAVFVISLVVYTVLSASCSDEEIVCLSGTIKILSKKRGLLSLLTFEEAGVEVDVLFTDEQLYSESTTTNKENSFFKY